MGKGGSAQESVPKAFQPAYQSLFNSAFGAGRVASGQYGGQSPPGSATQQSNQILGGGGGQGGFGLPGGQSSANLYQQPGQDIFGGGFQNVPQLGGGESQFTGGDRIYNGSNYYEIPGGNKEASETMPLISGPPIIGQPFGEQFMAGTSPLEFQSLQHKEGIANQLQGIGNPLLDLGTFTAEGGFLHPDSNPYLLPQMEAALRPITQEFTQSVLPQFGSQAIQSGAFGGSSARDMAFNQLASGYGQQVLDTGSQVAFDNYMRERQFQQGAGALLDQGAMLNQLTPELLAQTGLGYRELAQRPLDEALLQYQESIQAPFRPLNQMASIIQGTNIGQQYPQAPGLSPLSGGILGGLGGAGAGLNIYNELGGGDQQGLAALLGGALGGAGGALG
jgi:hypothetical protein